MLKAPPRQNAADTISTLASRLASATLLEDRRGAILGLRSFAKHYPASVASNSLRDLIECLRANSAALGKDVGDGDVDTIRSILETFKMLFEPDEDSPEASDEIRLYIADEFSQRQDNITILLDLLDTPDYYVRTHSLGLLLHISSARLERTQECILAAPLGTARLVGVLDDGRAAVRLDALTLLVDLTMVSQTELQKLIAFEDAYARIFALIKDDGGILEGGRVVEQCLALLANLVRHSTSNQSLFRESGCIRELHTLITTILDLDKRTSTPETERAAWGLLAVVRLFLERGELGTKANQGILWKNGFGLLLLDIAFRPNMPPAIASMALLACSDLIEENPDLQLQFSGSEILLHTEPDPSLTNGHKPKPSNTKTPAVNLLMDVILRDDFREKADYRQSACTLLKSMLFKHAEIRHFFLDRAIYGYREGENVQVNLLVVLLSGPPSGPGADIMRYVYASEIFSRLVTEDDDAKSKLLDISEGDPDKGEDVITATQSMASHLCTCLLREAEPQVTVAYLCFLITLYFESPRAVNDCLADGSALLGSLVNTASMTKHSHMDGPTTAALLPGLCAVLLGVLYEFSSKDSPIPRRTLEPFLVGRLGRQRYFDALLQLRQHHAIRDAGLGMTRDDEDEVFVDPAFVDWFRDEYGRLRRVIDRDPGLEILARNHAGVDRDILDDLRSQMTSKEQALQELEQQKLHASQHADQLEAEHRKEVQSLQSSQRNMTAELDAIKRINQALQTDHRLEIERSQKDHRLEVERLQQEAKIEGEKTQKAHKTANENSQQQHEREVERLKGHHGASLASERSLWEDKSRRAVDQAARDSESKLAEVKATLQSRDNELVVAKQDHQTAVHNLEIARDESKTLSQTVVQLNNDLQKSKDLQAGLQHVNTKALGKIKTLEEEVRGSEKRNNTVMEERDGLVEEKTRLTAQGKELHDEVQGLKSELAVERKGFGELEKELEKAKKHDQSVVVQKLKAEVEQLKKNDQSTQIQRLENELARLKKNDQSERVMKLEKEVEQGKRDLEQAKKNDNKGKKSDQSEAVKKLEKLEKELDGKAKDVEFERAEAQKAKTELEDMLMVMADIESKRDEYKARLKKAGETVSEDEDDDDDDDDEDDEE